MQVPSPDLLYPGTIHPCTCRPRAGIRAHRALPFAIYCTVPAELR